MATLNIPAALLAWFDERRRALPWRREPREPYRTWISEVMLQQTRVEAVQPYFERFLEAFPDVETLAEAPEEEVLKRWAGLGYYRRARLLHRAAGLVAERGGFPRGAEAWRELPGIGEYTAAAIASLADGEAVPVVDGNVKRVAARVLGLRLAADDPALHRAAREWGESLMAALPDAAAPGALNEALMELGATCCTPRKPACAACPIAAGCAAAADDAERYPAPRKPTEWKEVALLFLLAHDDAGRWLLRRRDEGWNPGLWEPPSVTAPEPTDSAAGADLSVDAAAALFAALGYRASALQELGACRHVITRHRIHARVLLADSVEAPPAEWRAAADVPLTALARKALKLAAARSA